MAKEVMLSDGPGGGGGDFSAPPPPGGLGNFKGVMLCNRPTEISMDKAVSGGDAPAPFKSTVSATHNDQLGLAPCKAREFKTDSEAKLRGPSAALRKHVKWLKQLQKEMGEERSKIEEEHQQDEKKKERMKKFCEKQRDAVKSLLTSDFDVKQEHLEQAVQVSRKDKDGKRIKPLWAMTENEKDKFQEEEANELLAFADNLDFDQYIGDLEFRQNLEVLKDRAGKLVQEQDSFKEDIVNQFNEDEETTAAGSPREDAENRSLDLEGSSLGIGEGVDGLGGKKSRRSKKMEGAPDWDSSTCCGDELQSAVADEDRDMAAKILEQNPGVRAIHSEKSIQKILEKQRDEKAKELVDLVEHLKNDVAPPDPKIVVSSDTQGKAIKKVDPSMLPYLYRSPAI